MGGVLSVGVSERRRKLTNISKKEEERKRQQKEEDERRRRLLEKYGVLVPPVFLANKTDDPPLSSRVWERIIRESSSFPSGEEEQPLFQRRNGSSGLLPWAYRRHSKADTYTVDDDEDDDDLDVDAGPLLGQTLLTEYMIPGLFLSLPVSASRETSGSASGSGSGGRFIAAVTQQPFSANDDFGLPSFLSLTKHFHRNSSVFFPLPWKIETFLPQHALVSSSASGILPSSMRVTADLSSPFGKNQTRVSWTTHFLDQHSDSNLAIERPSSPGWRKLRGSWIEAETVRPNWLDSGISLRMASATTLNCFVDNILLEACRYGNDAYLEHRAPESTKDGFGSFLRRFRKQKSHQPHDETLRFRFSAEYKESIFATNTNLCLSSLLGTGSTPAVTVTDTLLSLNLNGGADDQRVEKNKKKNLKSSAPPPLWLTLQQSKSPRDNSVSSWSLNLSHVVTFDREIWNILEDRAPRVRNHVGWVCQIERFQNPESADGNAGDGASSSSSSSSDASTSVLSVGASAQFNRNIAAKAILESKIGSSPSSSSKPSAALKYAFVFKRWLEPRASLSVIQSIDLFTGKFSFLGLGLEIEQDKDVGTIAAAAARRKQRKDAHANPGVEYRDTTDGASSVAPPTRVQVDLPETGEK